MTVIAMPTSANLVSFSILLDQRQQVNRSEWTGKRKVTGLPGAQKWTAKFNPHEIHEKSIKKEWRAFIIALRGQANIFNLVVAKVQHGGSNPVVGAGANAGATLPLTGLPVSATLLEAGDFMTVPLPSGHNRLVMLTADLTANGAGEATAQFWPYLNEVPTLAASVETINPYCPMALTSGEQGWSDEYGAMRIEFDVEEAL